MKTPLLPGIRVDPQPLADLRAVLRDGESEVQLVEAEVRRAVKFRRIQKAFVPRTGEVAVGLDDGR